MNYFKQIAHKISQLTYRLGTVLIRTQYVPSYNTSETSVEVLRRQLNKANDDALALHSLRRELAALRNERNPLQIRNSVLSIRLKAGI